MSTNIICVLTCTLSFYCCPPSPLVTEIVEATERPATTVIFLHGTGESGPEAKTSVQKLIGSFSDVPNLRFVFPTARPIRFSPFPWNGQLSNTWYDINAFRLNSVENTRQIEESAEELKRIVDEQIRSGVPPHRICVVGFSRGGSMALHMGYEYIKDLGCVGVLSSWLPTTSKLFSRLLTTPKGVGRQLPPIYFSIGTLDPLVRQSWVESTAKLFRSAGIPTSLKVMSGTTHKLTKSAVQGLFKFIELTIT
ncbi:lysophospholipase-like protein 1 [Halyomorpha halys]|uniref:lysophospholipase-like protein 1 n=1 Tax=Halyomorpha halys TaxID=286706 RepID=UPI0006D512A0|nr:lysophospholipase-like protein 1 [Halyomorpha halys]